MARGSIEERLSFSRLGFVPLLTFLGCRDGGRRLIWVGFFVTCHLVAAPPDTVSIQRVFSDAGQPGVPLLEGFHGRCSTSAAYVSAGTGRLWDTRDIHGTTGDSMVSSMVVFTCTLVVILPVLTYLHGPGKAVDWQSGLHSINPPTFHSSTLRIPPRRTPLPPLGTREGALSEIVRKALG